MTNIDDLVEYYSNLLIIQYHDQPNAVAMVELCVREALANGVAFDVENGYSVDTAIGKQLDVIGKYVGVDRFYQGQNLSGYFAFTNYEEITPDPGKRGFTYYSTYPLPVGQWLDYADILSSNQTLNDDDFRILIKLKIIQNYSNHSYGSINNEIFAFFPGTLRPDSAGNMVMYYFVSAAAAAIIQVAFQKAILPKPMGVRLNYLIRETSVFFGFSTYDYVPVGNTGFTDYAEYGTKVGETLDYNKLLSA